MIAFCTLLVACSSPQFTPLPVSASPVAAYVVAKMGAAEEVLELHVYDASELPDPLLLETDGAVRYRVLEYDHSLALEVARDRDHRATVLTLDAPTADGLPLDTPLRSLEIGAGDAAFTVGDGLAAWRASFRVARAACPALPVTRPITGLEGNGHVSFILPLGDQLLFGVERTASAAAGVYRLPMGETNAQRVAAFSDVAGDVQLSPQAFVDGGLAHVLWRENVLPFRLELVSIDTRGVVVDRHFVEYEGAPQMYPTRMVLGGIGSTVLMRGRQYFSEPGIHRSALFVLDELARVFRLLAVGPDDASRECSEAFESLILESDGTTSTAGLLGGPINRYEGSTPAGSALPGTFCRNARATLADGAEMFVFEERGASGPRTTWRTPGGAWLDLPSRTVSGQMVVAVGNLALVGEGGGTVAIYQHLPTRLDIEPRRCGEQMTGVNAYLALALDDHRVIIGGGAETRAALLEFAP